MEETMRETELYAEILKLRPIIKAIQQTSWEIGTIEKRYPLGTLTADEMVDVLEMYHSLLENITKQINHV